ncbi:MAG: PQQ-binding-like beta-propeller repeat protein [Candidatus Eremiobacteraeota bacterium]|nr:PQQ-binding-like beta-propeller repeat protein [Candidatus Eremiobacteraeota bacterium]
MEIDGLGSLQGAHLPGKKLKNDLPGTAVNDTVTLGGAPAFSSVTSQSVANQLFSARNILWSTTWKSDGGTGKGLIKLPDGDLLAGTYCDLTKISTRDGSVSWTRPIMEKKKMRNLSTSPALVAKDGSLLIGTTDGVLYSLNADTGKEIWSYKSGAYSTKPMQAPDGTIYVQKDKDIAALTPSGKEKFTAPIGRDRQEIEFVGHDGAVYIKSDNELFAVNADGSRRWQDKGSSVTGFDGDPTLYVTASKDVPHPQYKNSTTVHTLVSARDPKSGGKLWENEYDYATVGGYFNGKVLVYEHDRVSALDASTGKAVWDSPGKWMRKINTVLSDGTVILTTHGQFEALDGKTGRQKWTMDIKSLPLDTPALETKDGHIIIGDGSNIYRIDPSDGALIYKVHLDKDLHGISVSGDERVVYAEESGTGAIHAVDFRNAAEMAKDLQEKPPAEAGEGGGEGSSAGGVTVEEDYVIIDGVKIPKKKQGQPTD